MQDSPMRKNRGFSLVELLVALAIVLVAAAIAIPNLLGGRIAANEASAVASVRAVNTAETSYKATYPTVGYSATLAALGAGGACPNRPDQNHACLIDDVLATNGAGKGKTGYSVTYNAAAGGNANLLVTYNVNANPLVNNQMGVRSFCSVEDGVVRYQASGGGLVCDGSKPPLE
jgi:type IV pilus assembly protein PilA